MDVRDIFKTLCDMTLKELYIILNYGYLYD